MSFDYDDYNRRWQRRNEPKTTISVKLTAAELEQLDALRKKVEWPPGQLEPRGDALRRLLERPPARKTKARSRNRKTAGAR